MRANSAIGVLVVLLLGSFLHAAEPVALPPTLTVTGTAEAAAKPDLAILSFGAEAWAERAAAAQDKLNETMNRVIAAVKAMGIDEKEIRTLELSLMAEFGKRKDKPSNFHATNTIEVRLHDLPKVGTVIDAAVGNGANTINAIEFTLSNDTEPRKAALREATARARAKAEALAEASGVKLDSIEEISEGGVRAYPMMQRGMAYPAAQAETAATPIQSGQVRFEAAVTIRYRISAAK
jgi:uncharacterized protein YggE